MSYLTLEVRIDHGRVVAKEPSKLPETANGLLTIFPPDGRDQSCVTPLQALEALQKHLCLDADKAARWIAAVRDARR